MDKKATLGSYSPVFLAKKKEMVDPKTYRMYTNVLKNHLADYQDKPLAQFTPSTITHILATTKAHDRKGRVLGSAGLSLKKQLRSTLHSLFEDAKRDRIIPSNPAEKLPIPQSKDAQYKEVGQIGRASCRERV